MTIQEVEARFNTIQFYLRVQELLADIVIFQIGKDFLQVCIQGQS